MPERVTKEISSFEGSVSNINNLKQKYIYTILKRNIDIILAIIGLFCLSPLLLIISLFYLFGENRGPIIFKQLRIGRDGKGFYIYKFRSMLVNAEEKLKSDKELYRKYLQNNYKLEQHEDPRITKFGQFIRKTSLDEIPQLFNVLKGDMSIVGPRPVVKNELYEYKDRVDIFLSVKPGITGFWQVSGRSGIGYPERVEVELYYIYNQSFKLDIKIIIKTFIMVFKQKGAY
jgi:exopolysaccharide production protein ExoY